jgi:hypothetical protein
MSGYLVRDHALKCAREQVAGDALRDVEATIRRVDERFLHWLYQLSTDAGHEWDEMIRRTSAILFQFASVQLADDLADGDCDYLPQPQRTGPGTQWLLQHLYCLALSRSAVPNHQLGQATADFLAVGAAQQQEVRASKWDLASSRNAAIGLNGCQHRAYFRLMFAGTPHEHQAEALGYHFGFALHVTGDRFSKDRRFTDLDAAEQGRLLEEATESLSHLEAGTLPSVRGPAQWFRTVIELPL